MRFNKQPRLTRQQLHNLNNQQSAGFKIPSFSIRPNRGTSTLVKYNTRKITDPKRIAECLNRAAGLSNQKRTERTKQSETKMINHTQNTQQRKPWWKHVPANPVYFGVKQNRQSH